LGLGINWGLNQRFLTLSPTRFAVSGISHILLPL
jgi:hypothetical protein